MPLSVAVLIQWAAFFWRSPYLNRITHEIKWMIQAPLSYLYLLLDVGRQILGTLPIKRIIERTTVNIRRRNVGNSGRAGN